VNTGDGAGVLLQMPHKFLAAACKKAQVTLPNIGEYGCGLVFMPRNPTQRRRLEERFGSNHPIRRSDLARLAHSAHQQFDVGRDSQICEPFIRQVFIGRNPELKDELAFERKLYVIRAGLQRHSHVTLSGGEAWYLPACPRGRWSTKAC